MRYLSQMKTLFALLFILASMFVKAQAKIELTDVLKHVGDSVIVKGKVFSSRAVGNGKFLINLGGAYPYQLLTVVLDADVQKVLAEPLKLTLEELSVAGKLELYKEKPQLVVKDALQIQSLITVKPANNK